jgi:hypothetical protein
VLGWAPRVIRTGHAVLGLSAAASACALGDWTAGALLLTLLATAVLLADGRSVLACLPTALVLVIAAVIAASLTAPLVHLRPLGDPETARALLLMLVLAPPLLLTVRPADTCRGRPVFWSAPGELVACAPAALLVGIGAWFQTAGATRNTVTFLRSGDNAGHLRYVRDLVNAGVLDYGSGEAYPRGWHAFLAWVQTAGGRGSGAESVAQLTAAAAWGLYALLAAAAGLLAVQLCAGRSRGQRRLAGLGAAGTMLSGSFFGFAVGFGYQTSVLLTLVLLVAGLELSKGRRSRLGTALVGSASLLVVAHTWQLALPGLGIVWLIATCRPASGRSSASGWLGSAAVAVAALVLSVPPMIAVTTKVGIGAVGAPGLVPRLAVSWLLPALALAAVTLLHRRPPLLYVTCLLTVAATAVALAGAVGASLNSYYPTKLLWEAAAMGVPLVWAYAVPTLAELRERTRRLLPRGALYSVLVATAFTGAPIGFLLLAACTPALMLLRGTP